MLQPSTVYQLATHLPPTDTFVAPREPGKRRRLGRRVAGAFVR